MGLIRKTVSIATLGIVDFRSQKEQVRRAEKAQRAAQAELAGVEQAGAPPTSAWPRPSSEPARPSCSRSSRPSSPAGQDQAPRPPPGEPVAGPRLHRGAGGSAGPAVEERAKDLEPARHARRPRRPRKQAEAAAGEGARKQARSTAGGPRQKIDEVADAASELVDEHR